MNVSLKDGFKVTVNESALNDWRLLKMLRKVDKGESGLIVDIAEMLLGGEEEVDKLADHFDQSSEDIINAITEIITAVGELKNS